MAILDLSRRSDPDHLARCGVNLDGLLIARPRSGAQVVHLLLDPLRIRRLGLLLLDNLPDLIGNGQAAKALADSLAHLNHAGSSRSITCLRKPGIRASRPHEHYRCADSVQTKKSQAGPESLNHLQGTLDICEDPCATELFALYVYLADLVLRNAWTAANGIC